MPLAGHDLMAGKSLSRHNISTPMPLAGHDRRRTSGYRRYVGFLLPCPSRGMTTNGGTAQGIYMISTPMPLAGHDEMASPFFGDIGHFYSHAPRGA